MKMHAISDETPSFSVAMPAEKVAAVNQEQQIRLDEIAGIIMSANISSTECAFVYGKCFAEAKAILPKKEFGGWLKGVSRYTIRSAWNFILVHERLSKHREVLVNAGLATTELFEMARGEPQAVSELAERIGHGERFNRTQIRSLLGIQKKKAEKKSQSAILVGGEVGLQAVVQAKIVQDMTLFRNLCSYILKAVEIALHPLELGKAVNKSRLRNAILQECRNASTLIDVIASPMTLQIETRLYPGRLPEDTPWGRVQKILHRMESEDKWPVRSDFVPWLQGEVLPLLKFTVHGDPLPEALIGSESQPETTTVAAGRDVTQSEEVAADGDRITVGAPPLDPVDTVPAEELKSVET